MSSATAAGGVSKLDGIMDAAVREIFNMLSLESSKSGDSFGSDGGGEGGVGRAGRRWYNARKANGAIVPFGCCAGADSGTTNDDVGAVGGTREEGSSSSLPSPSPLTKDERKRQDQRRDEYDIAAEQEEDYYSSDDDYHGGRDFIRNLSTVVEDDEDTEMSSWHPRAHQKYDSIIRTPLSVVTSPVSNPVSPTSYSAASAAEDGTAVENETSAVENHEKGTDGKQPMSTSEQVTKEGNLLFVSNELDQYMRDASHSSINSKQVVSASPGGAIRIGAFIAGQAPTTKKRNEDLDGVALAHTAPSSSEDKETAMSGEEEVQDIRRIHASADQKDASDNNKDKEKAVAMNTAAQVESKASKDAELIERDDEELVMNPLDATPSIDSRSQISSMKSIGSAGASVPSKGIAAQTILANASISSQRSNSAHPISGSASFSSKDNNVPQVSNGDLPISSSPMPVDSTNNMSSEDQKRLSMNSSESPIRKASSSVTSTTLSKDEASSGEDSVLPLSWSTNHNNLANDHASRALVQLEASIRRREVRRKEQAKKKQKQKFSIFSCFRRKKEKKQAEEIRKDSQEKSQ